MALDKRVVAGVLVLVVVVVLGFLYASPSIRIDNVRYTYTGKSAGVFFEAYNMGLRTVCIVGASLEGVNAKVELHETVEENGAYRMQPVEKVCIGPFQTVEFRPKGLHVMVMGGVDPGGETLILYLDNGDEIRIQLPEEPMTGLP